MPKQPRFPRSWPKEGWRVANEDTWLYGDPPLDCCVQWRPSAKQWRLWMGNSKRVTSRMGQPRELWALFITWKLTGEPQEAE